MIVFNKGKIILFTFIISVFMLLKKKRKYTLTIFYTLLIVLGTSLAGYADITPVSERTPQVRDAIVAAVPGVDAAADVTEAHLAAITSLNLRGKGISALKTSDFSGLTALTSLNLYNNQLSGLPDGIFEVLTSLTTIRLGQNTVDPLPITVALEKMAEDQFKAVAPTGAPFNIVLPINVKNGRATGGATTLTIPHGSVESNTLTVARTAGTTAHVAVDIGTLPSLPRLNHYGYALVKSDNLPLIIIRGTNMVPVFSDGTTAIRSVAENTARGVNIGAPVSAIDADNDTLTYTLSGTDAASFGIDSTSGQLQTKAALDYETKTSYSVAVSVSDGYGGSDSIAVTINVTDVHENRAPVFTDGANTTRTIAENTASGQHIGTAVAATDADGNTLAYTLSGTDAASFGIDKTTGQLKTKAPLDYETKTAYTVTVTVSDGTLTDTITVTINVTDMDENRAPVFTDGNSATRTVAENTTAGTNIGNAITATDLDNDTLTYTLGGTDASSFSIVSTSGQLRTRAALDYETKASYSITISVSDGSLTDIITVTINITDVNENIAPVFTEGNSTTRSVAENTVAGAHIGTAVSATDANNDTLIYTLSGTDASAFSIDSATGRLQTKGALDYEIKKTYTVTITVSDGKLTDTINVTINITDIDETIPNRAPVFTEGSTTTRAVAENTAAGQHIGTAVAATDADGNTLAYTLSGTDAASFGIDRTTGQLKTKTALDYETKTAYTVTVTVSDGTLTDTITVTINVTDVNETPTNNAPVFTEGTSATRSIAENTASGQHIGSAVSATDVDNDTLTYSLGGTDAASFSIVSTSGQLQTSAALDYETKTSYSVTITVSDGSLTDSITVTIIVTDVNETPTNNAPEPEPEPESNLSIVVINSPGAGDPGDWLTFIVEVQEDESPSSGQTVTFSIEPDDGTLSVLGGLTSTVTGSNGRSAATLVLGNDASGTYTVTASSGTASVSRTVTVGTLPPLSISISSSASNAAPGDTVIFTASVQENNTPAPGQTVMFGVNRYRFTPPDDIEFLPVAGTVSLSSTSATTDSNGQASTSLIIGSGASDSYGVSATLSDGRLDVASVTVEASSPPVFSAPVFTEGTSTTRSIAENTASGQHIGTAVAATDADGNTLAYTLSGTDAASFGIDRTTGQLKTKTALDYETKTAYTVTVIVSDGTLTDTITVTINVTDVNETPTNNAPVFSEGTSTTRSVAENTASGTNIGTAVAATDADNDTLTYTLGGTDAASFSIVSTTGQLQTSAALDYETKTSYSVMITVSDGSLTDSITVTINVTDVNETPTNNAPEPEPEPESNLSIVVVNNPGPGYREGYNPYFLVEVQVDEIPAQGHTVTFSIEPDDGNVSFAYGGPTRVTASNGRSGVTLEIGDRASGTYTVTASSGTVSVSRTVTVGTVPSLSVSISSSASNAAPGDTVIFTATVTENNNPASGQALTFRIIRYTGTSIDIEFIPVAGTASLSSTSATTDSNGQASTSLTIGSGASGSYAVSATLIDGRLDVASVTVEASSPPVFSDDTSTTRSIAENTAPGIDIGSPISATDPDGDTLTYSLSGTDAASFSIDSSTGQLRTKAALDYETKKTYTVTITVSDGKLTDTINVTINITDIDETIPNLAPVAQLVPSETVLLPNYPNPFNPETWIPYQLAKPAEVALTIYDMRGVVVRQLKLGHKAAGMYTSRSHAIHWDGRNMFGEKVATGLYFYTFKAGDFTATRKMLIRK